MGFRFYDAPRFRPLLVARQAADPAGSLAFAQICPGFSPPGGGAPPGRLGVLGIERRRSKPINRVLDSVPCDDIARLVNSGEAGIGAIGVTLCPITPISMEQGGAG